MKKIPVGADNRGFTLLEMAIVLAVLALTATAAIPYFIRQAEIAGAQKTTKEVSIIQEAAKWYYVDNNTWPASVGTLQSAGFLNSSWSPTNPWGNAYSISSNATSFSITTSVPSDVAGVLTGALPDPTASGGTVTSVVPVPGQEASLTSVTNLANQALNTANTALTTSAVPPPDSSNFNNFVGDTYGVWGNNTGACPIGYVMVGYFYINGGLNFACGKISR